MTENEWNESLEQMMRDELEQKTFELKDAYWLDARKMIDANRKKRRGFFFLFTGLLLLGITGILLAGRDTISEPAQTQAQPANKSREVSPKLLADKQSRAAEMPHVSTPGADDDQPAVPVSDTHKSTKNDPKPGNRVQESNTIATKTQTVKSVPVSGRHKTGSGHNKITPSIPAGLPGLTLATPPKSPLHDAAEPVNDMHDEIFANERTTGITPAPETTALTSLASGYVPALIPFTWCDSCTRNYFCAPDSNQKPRDIFESSYWSAQAGLNYYNPAGARLNAHTAVGLQYHYLLHPRLYLVSGVYYTQLQQHLGDLHYAKVSYSFGRDEDRTTIGTTRLDYVQVPVQASYRLFANNFVSGGFTYGYVLQSANQVTRQASAEATAVSYKDQGYTYAVNRSDVQLNIGYTLLLPRKLQLSCTYGFGITDVSKNNVFRSTTFDRNHGFRFSIGYKLLQK